MIEETSVRRNDDGNVVISLPSRRRRRMIEHIFDPQSAVNLHGLLGAAIGHDCMTEAGDGARGGSQAPQNRGGHRGCQMIANDAR